MRLSCQAILFDMDGVIVDSTICVEESWRRFAKRHGIDEAYLLSVCHGRPAHLTIAEVAPHLDEVELGRQICIEQATDDDNVVLVPGAKELLCGLPQGRWAVNTSATKYLAHKRFDDLALPKPQVFITAGNVSAGKPSPEGYLKAAQGLGYEASECIVFEDSPVGLQAAEAAGMRAVAVKTTFEKEQLPQSPLAYIADLTKVKVEPAEQQVGLTIELRD